MPDVLKGPEARPRLLVLVSSAMHLRDFSDCGALSLLAERFDTDFVYSDPAIGDQLARYGGRRLRHTNPRLRYWLWNCASTLEYLRKYRSLIAGMNRHFFNRKRAGSEYWHWSAKVGYLLGRARLNGVATPVIKWLLNRTVTLALRIDPSSGYSAVIVPTVLRDLTSEDMIRLARNLGIPSIAIQGNWDCFNLKEMLAKPDHFLLWGEQSWYFARVLERMPHASLRVIGSQRHDHYFRQLPDKAAARRRLGLSLDRPILLFCGVLSPFDELAALRELDRAIVAGVLPATLQILYKPHPKATPDKRVDEFDRQGFRNITLFGFRGKEVWNSLEEYPTLIRAVDATVSAYSTMGLESALCGRPTLCLGYLADERVPYWRFALEFLHLQSYHFSRWSLSCRRAGDLVGSVERLLTMAADPDIERSAIDATGHVIYRDELPYPERLCGAIEAIIGVPQIASTRLQTVAAC